MADQYAVPSSDVADGEWVNESGTATNLFQSVNEDVGAISDADWIKSALEPTVDTCKLALSALTVPGSGTVTLRVRGKKATKTEYPFYWDAVVGATSYVLQVGTASGVYNCFNADVGYVRTYYLNLSTGTYFSRVVPQGDGSPTVEQTVTVP